MKAILPVLVLAILCYYAVTLCHALDPSLVMSLVGVDKQGQHINGTQATCTDNGCSQMICDISNIKNVTRVFAVTTRCEDCRRLGTNGRDITMMYWLRGPCISQYSQCDNGECSREMCYDCNQYGTTVQYTEIQAAACF